ncbi:hypothetical protein [uncultured Roseobacter sp.]|uniref:hypothetical protein n=1 Tax=uncultured Roseobacter sp. TaxID=114847 RepID=UPI0026247A95|nr:hypothetical protein [uncultured Roseobacter sp.]
MIEDFLPRHEDDDVLIKAAFPIPEKKHSAWVRLPKYYWRLLDWMSDRRNVTAGYIIHHYAISRYEDWNQISGYFVMFIDDWIKWEAEGIAAKRKVHRGGCNVYLNSSLPEKRVPAANDGRVKRIEAHNSKPPEVPE